LNDGTKDENNVDENARGNLLANVGGWRMSLARIIHKEIVTSRREPWVTKRMIVDNLTPYSVNFGLKTEKRGEMRVGTRREIGHRSHL